MNEFLDIWNNVMQEAEDRLEQVSDEQIRLITQRQKALDTLNFVIDTLDLLTEVMQFVEDRETVADCVADLRDVRSWMEEGE